MELDWRLDPSAHTVKGLRKALERLEALGFADNEVHVMQYAGGDDEPCYVQPVVPETTGGNVMLQTVFVK